MPCLRSLLALVLLTGVVAAEDWPGWLGPRRDGSSTEKVAPWKEAPKILWRQPIGDAHSSPIVADGKVFALYKIAGKDEEELAAFESATGKLLWKKSYARGKLPDKFITFFGVGPRATPIVEKGKVYTFGVTGILACWDVKDGTNLWTVDTEKEFKPPLLRFGPSCTPLIEGDKLLVNVGAKGASIVAFDKSNGKVLWKVLDDPASYSSPIALGEGKERQIVFLTQQGLVSISPTDGSVFWKVPLVDTLNESSTTPILLGDLLLGASVTFGSLGVKLETTDGKPTATQLWKNPRLTCYFSTPVPVGKDHLYLVSGGLISQSSTLHCVEMKTGKELWKKEKIAKYHAALIRTADDKLLMLDDTGHLTLLDPNPNEYKELARSKMELATPIWAHPALSDGKLFLRDKNELICVQMSK